jgi:hypothetical protein
MSAAETTEHVTEGNAYKLAVITYAQRERRREYVISKCGSNCEAQQAGTTDLQHSNRMHLNPVQGEIEVLEGRSFQNANGISSLG